MVFLVYGMAGTGKTTKPKQMKSILPFDEHITICPTHKACKLINGNAMHRMFGISPIGLSYEHKHRILKMQVLSIFS